MLSHQSTFLFWNVSKLFSNFIYFLILYFPTSVLCFLSHMKFFLYFTIFLEWNKLSISPSAHIKNNFHNLIMHNKLRQKENNSGRNVQNVILYIKCCVYSVPLYVSLRMVELLFGPIRRTRKCFKLQKILFLFVYIKWRRNYNKKILFKNAFC